MANAYESYRRAMSDPWRSWCATWPLSMPVRPGALFTVAGGTLRTAGTLGAAAIGFDLAAAARPGVFVYDAAGSVSVRFKAAGGTPSGFSALAAADAGALIDFHQDGSMLVVYQGVTQRGFADTRALAAKLVEQLHAKRWADDLVAVTDVVSAKAGTVLIAHQGGASAELRIRATLGSGPAELADLAAGASVARSHRLGFEWTGTRLTPFFRVVRVRQTWLGRVKTEYASHFDVARVTAAPVPAALLEEARDNPSAIFEEATGDLELQTPFEIGGHR